MQKWTFNESTDYNLAEQYNRVRRQNLASLIVIEGEQGQGKTTLAAEFVDYFNKLHGIEPMDISSRNQYSAGAEEFQSKMLECYNNNLPALIYDESGDFSNDARWSKVNLNLAYVFEQYRAFRIVVIMCLPNSRHLSNTLFDKGIVRLVFKVFGKSQNKYGKAACWSLRKMLFIRNDIKKYRVPYLAYKKQTPLFFLTWRPLSPERQQELDKICIASKLKSTARSVIRSKGLVCVGDIAKKLNRSEQWVRNTIVDLKLKRETVYNRHYYYDPGAVEEVRGRIKRG